MALNVLRQTAMALQKAGEMGVTHRDIKPENIMISPSGEVKVTDFGLARPLERNGPDGSDANRRDDGDAALHEPRASRGETGGPRSDLYSLGITAFHMLAGFAPFEGDTALAVALKQRQQSAPRSAADSSRHSGGLVPADSPADCQETGRADPKRLRTAA